LICWPKWPLYIYYIQQANMIHMSLIYSSPLSYPFTLMLHTSYLRISPPHALHIQLRARHIPTYIHPLRRASTQTVSFSLTKSPNTSPPLPFPSTKTFHPSTSSTHDSTPPSPAYLSETSHTQSAHPPSQKSPSSPSRSGIICLHPWLAAGP